MVVPGLAFEANGGESDFGGTEEVFGFVMEDETHHLGKGDAGDEVADVLPTIEGRHAAEVLGFGGACDDDFGFFMSGQAGLKFALVGEQGGRRIDKG